jgi:hypothetical protein
VQGEALGFLRSILGSRVLGLLMFGAVCILGYRAIAQDAGAPLVARVVMLETQTNAQAADIASMRRDFDAVRTQSLEMALNVRMLVRAQQLEPIVLVSERVLPDGGVR